MSNPYREKERAPPQGFNKIMPPSPIEAVIFDMDGVLADSEPLYHLSINQVLASRGQCLTGEANRAILGTTVDYTWGWLKERFRLEGDLGRLIAEYDSIVLKNLEENVVPSPGLYPLLDGLQARGLKLGLASSSQGNWVQTVLSTLGVADRFQVVVSGDMVKRGKPEPDIFLQAAATLEAHPSHCLVLEDSPHGIQAGKRAGMTVIAILTPLTRDLDLSLSDYTLESLADFDYAVLDRS